MEQDFHYFSPEELQQLARLEAAGQANEYLYQVLEIGQDMLQCGGEVSRVEDSIRRLCLAFGAERADVFTITSSIVVTIYAHGFGALTQTRRVMGTQYDLDRLELLRQTEANAFLSALLCSCLGGLLAGLAVRSGLGNNVDMISIGNIMLLIPGLALTNSLRDMFSGNTISGLMRFIEAILLALTIALGFAMVLALF